MGLIERLFSIMFGGGQNMLKDTAEVFRVNAEADADRTHTVQMSALSQHGAEFGPRERGWFDRLMDGVNRLPRPAMALGTLGLFVAAMVDPVWFAARMQGISLVPEPLWWLLGAIVSFYFGARHQFKGQEFQQSIAMTMARTPQVVGALQELDALQAEIDPQEQLAVADTGTDAQLTLEAVKPDGNAALEEWKRSLT